MEKKRVQRGKEYYFININFEVMSDYECETDVDDLRFENNNYFVTEEEAESMARKLRAVLNGADVVETPSEEEVKERLNMIIPTQPVEPWCVEGYCKHMIEFVLSKIVK